MDGHYIYGWMKKKKDKLDKLNFGILIVKKSFPGLFFCFCFFSKESPIKMTNIHPESDTNTHTHIQQVWFDFLLIK